MSQNNLPLFLFHQGTNAKAYEYMGSHLQGDGAVFRVWAPAALSVSVVGDFNKWDRKINPMIKISEQGVWELFIPNLKRFDIYKYSIETKKKNIVLKIDPYAFHFETPPATASKLYDIENYSWGDSEWLARRKSRDAYRSPMNIYELHAGSWKKHDDGSFYNYRRLADELVPYILDMGYTHIELMPITEYPYEGSWGYQVTGYFAPTSRYGEPSDFMYFVDKCHQNGIAVIVDWVPAHFPKDEHALYEYDGSYCYEYTDEHKREHSQWGTRIFDYGKCEVQSFLISSAMLLVEKYHIDGIRVDAVASMLYLDYGREAGEWVPNAKGGRENLEAAQFLQKLNSLILTERPDALMFAEESTAWPMVTKPPQIGGLGFNFKWNMGWMNDMLMYISLDPYFRCHNHDKLTFSMMYAFSENFVLPISHDEVVHGKRSLINKMPGEYADKFASMRVFLGYMMSHPGKKLLFMGSEFGQFIEWRFYEPLEWFLLDYPRHSELLAFHKELNGFYLENSECWEIDDSWEGFSWVQADNARDGVYAYTRQNRTGGLLLVLLNMSDRTYDSFPVGLRALWSFREVLNSDLYRFGGENRSNDGLLTAAPGETDGCPYTLRLKLPALTALILERCPSQAFRPWDRPERIGASIAYKAYL